MHPARYVVEATQGENKASVTWNVYATGEPRRAKNVILFIGDGMSIAIHSAARATQAYLAGDHADTYHARMRRDLRTQFVWGRLLSRVIGTQTGRKVLMGAATALPAMMPALAKFTRLPRLAQAIRQID